MPQLRVWEHLSWEPQVTIPCTGATRHKCWKPPCHPEKAPKEMGLWKRLMTSTACQAQTPSAAAALCIKSQTMDGSPALTWGKILISSYRFFSLDFSQASVQRKKYDNLKTAVKSTNWKPAWCLRLFRLVNGIVRNSGTIELTLLRHSS